MVVFYATQSWVPALLPSGELDRNRQERTAPRVPHTIDEHHFNSITLLLMIFIFHSYNAPST